MTSPAIRLWFQVASKVAPGLAERQAASLFLTPPRRPPRGLALPGEPAALTLDVEGMRLAGWCAGVGPAVLLLHGWGGSAVNLGPLAASLMHAGHRVLLFDMPAHGHSPGRRTSLAEWLRALAALRSWLGPVHAVVGHSLGGAAATLALAEGLDARGAVLVAPALGPAHFVERVSGHLGLSEARTAGVVRRLVARVGRDLDWFDAARAAVDLTMPALILHDPADTEVPWAHAQAIAAAWRGSRLMRCEGSGHYRIVSDPAAIAQATAFVAALPAN